MTVIVENLPVTDGGVTDGGVTDGSTDGGITDAGDGGTDAGIACSGVYNESAPEITVSRTANSSVGGYSIDFVNPTEEGIILDILCDADGGPVVLGEGIPTEYMYPIELQTDSKRMWVTVHSKNTYRAIMTVAVEDL